MGTDERRMPDQALILMYHRVGHLPLDPWRMAVTPEIFRSQLEVLDRKFEFSRLADHDVAPGKKPRVIITFDDGYRDNLEQAKPILESFGAPATVFVTTGVLDSSREFWWDELEQLFLLPGRLPRKADIDLSHARLAFDLGQDADYPEHTANALVSWKVSWSGEPPPTKRHQAFFDTWDLLRQLDGAQRAQAVDMLFEWAGAQRHTRSSHQRMTRPDLRELIDGGLIEIGSHTVSHSELSTMGRKAKRRELQESRQALVELTGGSILSIAYPHGLYDLETLELAAEAGYSLGLATNQQRVAHFDTRYQLLRTAVPNDARSAFRKRLGID